MAEHIGKKIFSVSFKTTELSKLAMVQKPSFIHFVVSNLFYYVKVYKGIIHLVHKYHFRKN